MQYNDTMTDPSFSSRHNQLFLQIAVPYNSVSYFITLGEMFLDSIYVPINDSYTDVTLDTKIKYCNIVTINYYFRLLVLYRVMTGDIILVFFCFSTSIQIE